MTEEEIYQFFLKHVPTDKLEAFKDVYKKWQAAPLPAPFSWLASRSL